MKKKELTINEIFCGMPHLKSYFQEQEKLIRKFGTGEVENPAVEDLKRKEKLLLDIVRNMNIEDLRVLQYVHNIKKLIPYRVVELLKKTSQAAEELFNLSKEIKEGAGEQL